jgi:transposase
MTWIDDELEFRRIDEKKKDSSIGTAKLFRIRVRVGGTLMVSAVYAENPRRAKKIAEELFGKGNIRGLPVTG